MNVKEAFDIINKYDLSYREVKELALVSLKEPPYDVNTRYKIKIKIIEEKIAELKCQIDSTVIENCNINDSIKELSVARDIIMYEMKNDFWLR